MANLNESRIIELAEVEMEDFLNYRQRQKYTQKSEVNNKKVPWPKPINSAAFIGLAGELVGVIYPHTEAAQEALLINFLVGFGNIIGDNLHFKVEASRHPMRIFAVLVGESSRGRKGTSWDYIRNLLTEVDLDWRISSGLSSGEGLIFAVRDKVTKVLPNKDNADIVEMVTDEGVSDKRLLIIEEEFSSTLRVLSREGNTLSAIIRDAWNTGDLKIMTKNNPTNATGAHVSILAHITRDELLRYLTNTESSNGFSNRFLFVCVKRSKELPSGGQLKDEDLAEIKIKLKKAILLARGLNKSSWTDDEINSIQNDSKFGGWQSNEIKWSTEAKIFWPLVYHDLTTDSPGIVGSMTARAEAYVSRLASLYAILDSSFEIKIEHLRAALAVWDYVYNSVVYIFQGKVGDHLSDKILTALEARPRGMTRSDINLFFSKNISSEVISSSLEILVKLNLIQSEVIVSGGRPSEVFTFNSFNTSPVSGASYLEKLDSYIFDHKNKSDT